MRIKRAIAALLALCLMLGGAAGALAEGDIVEDLLRYFLNIPDDIVKGQTPAPTQVPDATGVPTEAPAESTEAPVESTEAPARPASEPTTEPDAGPTPVPEFVPDAVPNAEGAVDGDGEAVYEDEEEIVVEALIDVDDYAVNDELPDDWTNILLLGTDSRTSQQYSRTDTMIVLSLNKATSQAKLTSIMRDTWVDIPDHGGAKLNAACVYGGPALTVRCVNENFGLNIQSYALVNMQCLVAIVDTLGGIRLDVTSAEAGAINRLIESDRNSGDANRNFAADKVSSGEQVLLNGKQVLAFSRIRKSDSDYARTGRQRAVLVTIAKRLQQENLFSLAGIVTSMLQYVETNLSFDEIMSIAATCMGLDVSALEEFRVPADGTFQSGMFGSTWCIKPDFGQNAALLKAFIYGE